MTARRRPGRRGQALTEFALVAPLFFFLLFSIIEFGRVVYYIQILNNAAREGARYAIVHGAEGSPVSGPRQDGEPSDDPTGENIKTTVKSYAVAIIDSGPADYTVDVKWCSTPECPNTNAVGQGDGTNARSQTVKVEVRYNFRPLLGMVPIPTFTLTGGSTLVVNH